MAQLVPRFSQSTEGKPSNMLWRPSIVQNHWLGRSSAARSRASGQKPSDGGDFGKVFRQLLANKRKLLLATLASLMLGLTYLALATPMYTATASLLVDPRSRKIEETVQSGIGGDTTLLESQVSVIMADGVLKRVAEKLKLASDPEFTSQPSALTRMLSAVFGRNATVVPPEEQALAWLRKSLKVARAQKTYVLDIAATANSPAAATNLVQAVLDAYFADQTEAKSAEAKRANELIDSRLGSLRDQLRLAETRVDDYRRANKILTAEGLIVNEQQLTRMNTEMASARGVAAEAKARRDQIQSAIKLGAEPDVLGDAARTGLIGKLREQYAQVARREASLATQLQPGHPLMVDVRSQLNAVKGQITAELKRAASAAESEYQVAANREKELTAQIDKSKQEVATVNTAQIRARELEQELASSRELLKKYIDNANETRQQESISTRDARVISPPIAPTAPTKPVSWLVLALSLLTGLGSGAAWALNSGTTAKSITDPEQFSDQTGLASVSAVPELKAVSTWQGTQDTSYGVQFSDVLAALGTRKDRDAAAFHQSILRLLSKIKSQGRAGRPNTVMFASPRLGSGNSAAVLAVAYSAALAGERVLLVDATSINPELSTVFAGNLPKSTTVILDSKEHLNRIVTRDGRSGLSFLPIALADLRTLKTQQRRRLVAGLNLVSQDYDWVFIDAGGLLDDEAATMLLPATSQVYISGRSGVTSRSDTGDMMEILAPARDRIAGAVLTFSPQARG
jgi:polysaccharide biosynthesis transport protein